MIETKTGGRGNVNSGVGCSDASKDLSARLIEHEWIKMPDGCHLAARLWIPSIAEKVEVPTIFEFIPYRKCDVTRARDDEMCGYFVTQGYACVRVDMRGSGDSEGMAPPMFDKQERHDGVAVLRWIAAQPWSNGKVGMIGLSWGGSNALFCAAEHPPELGAIICVAGPHDSYGRDLLYKGGCLTNEVLRWANTLDGLNARPPNPSTVGKSWRPMWQTRLHRNKPEVFAYLRHQRRDDFWHERDLTEQLSSFTCPAFIVGGWADSSVGTNAPDLIAAMPAPRRGLMGPWAHCYPHHGVPGPAIDFLFEAVDWFDQHLKKDTLERPVDPALRAWMLEDVPARPFYPEAPGRWVAEPIWPSPNISPLRMFLNKNELGSSPLEPFETDECRSSQTVGMMGGKLMPSIDSAPREELPGDQSEDDAKSLCYTSPPLVDRLEILGAPEITLSLKVDRPLALIAVRLCDVAPNGKSKRVSYAVQNLTHRNSDMEPSPLIPGDAFQTRIRLHDIAYAFRPGHRVRIALSTTYWPLCWPSPEPVTLKVRTGESFVDLPRRLPRDDDPQLRHLSPPRHAPLSGRTVLRRPWSERKTVYDNALHETTLHIRDDAGCYRVDFNGIEVTSRSTETYKIRDDDPLSARMSFRSSWELRRADWHVRIESSTEVSCTLDRFVIDKSLYAYDGDALVHSKVEKKRIHRDHM